MTINKLYNLDCRTVEYKETDLIISDPPYNIGYSYLEYNDKMTEVDYYKLFETFKGKRLCFINNNYNV